MNEFAGGCMQSTFPSRLSAAAYLPSSRRLKGLLALCSF